MTLHGGSPCPEGCGGQMRIRTSVRSISGRYYYRYLVCRQCKARRKIAIPAEKVLRREPRQAGV